MRNRYLDLLRAAAIVRVIVYHLFGWPWLSIVFPAMGVMFALAGSLAAASLDKRTGGQVVVSRLRRLLPPLWLLGLIAVPVMLVAGWAQEGDGEHPFSLARLGLWLLPIGDPPGSDKGIDVWEPLWYIRAYLWFVLLSPLLYPIYRRLGWVLVAAPLVLMVALDLTGFELPAAADAEMWDFVTYGACWLAGFAHHDGRLARIKPWALVPVSAVLGAAGLYWLAGHQGEDLWDLNDVSESQALWSLAFVLLALRWQPAMGWLARVKPLDSAVTLLNDRAVTIYLWHNIAIAIVWPVLTVLALDDLGARMEGITEFAVALALTACAVLAFGWAEDLAAKRRPRLWPGSPSGGSGRPQPEAPPPDGPAPLLAGDRSDRGATLGDGGGQPNRGIGRRTGAAAAMSGMPRNWPPLPRTGRTGDDSADAGSDPDPAAGRPTTHGERTRDLGLPVAGRRVEPLAGEPAAAGPLPAAPPSLPPSLPTPAAEPLAGEVLELGQVTGRPAMPWTGPVAGNDRPDWFLQRRGGSH